jgi:hypothetical protein
LLEREERHARCGELEREWEVVETTADLRDGAVHLEVGLNRARPGEEELDALVGEKRWDRVLLFARHVEGFPARYEQFEPGAGRKKAGDFGGGLDDMLEVVEHEEQRPIGDGRGEIAADPERMRGRCRHELRVTQRGQWHPPDAVPITTGDFDGCLRGEPGLAAAARSGQGEQTNVVAHDQADDLVQFARTAEKRRRRHRQVTRQPVGLRHRERCGRLPRESGIVREDLSLEFLQGGAGFDPELVDENPSRLGVDGERIRLAARAVEGEHKLAA